MLFDNSGVLTHAIAAAFLRRHEERGLGRICVKDLLETTQASITPRGSCGIISARCAPALEPTFDRFEQRRLLETNKRLRLALSAHKDPNAVRTIAKDRLGMRSLPAKRVKYSRIHFSAASFLPRANDG